MNVGVGMQTSARIYFEYSLSIWSMLSMGESFLLIFGTFIHIEGLTVTYVFRVLEGEKLILQGCIDIVVHDRPVLRRDLAECADLACGSRSFLGLAMLLADVLAVLGLPAQGINQDPDHQRSSWPSL